MLFVDCELLSFKVDDDLNFHTLPHYLSIWMGVLLSMLKRILDNFQFLLLTDLLMEENEENISLGFMFVIDTTGIFQN